MTDDTEQHVDDVVQDDSDEQFPSLPKNDPVPAEVDTDEESGNP